MKNHSDGALVERAKQGDKVALGELFSRYWKATRATAFGVTGEFYSAEDAAAEAFRQALSTIKSLRDPERFGPWLRKIVMRQAQRNLRTSSRSIEDFDETIIEDQNKKPDEILVRLELEFLVRQAISELPILLRETISLVYVEGYSIELATHFLNIPAGTLRRRLHDGRISIQKSVEQKLKGKQSINSSREFQERQLKALFESNQIYKALRETLALRPPPVELMSGLLQQHMDRADHLQSGSSSHKFTELFARIQTQILKPSQTLDSDHPIALMELLIRKALPEFQNWKLTTSDPDIALQRFSRNYGNFIRTLLPPGFAEGRPGNFIRSTRAIVYLDKDKNAQSMYEHLKNSADEKSFQLKKEDIRISHVLDLTWMIVGSLELRSVQELLEKLISEILPGAKALFLKYDEPRYRSALQVRIAEPLHRAAYGGVLALWPGFPSNCSAAHLRIFIEPLATLKFGQFVEFEKFEENIS